MARSTSLRKTRWSTADLEPHLAHLGWTGSYTGRDQLGNALAKITRANENHLFVKVYRGQQLVGYQLTELGESVALRHKRLRVQRGVDQMLVVEQGQ